MTKQDDFIYLSAVKDKGVVKRYGSSGFIGARLVKGSGFHVDPDRVVRIPIAEFTKYLKPYNRALKDGALIRRTAKDYDAFQKKIVEAADVTAKSSESAPDVDAPKDTKSKSKTKSPQGEKQNNGGDQ